MVRETANGIGHPCPVVRFGIDVPGDESMRLLRWGAIGTLVVGGGLLAVANVLATIGAGELQALREELASSGGGVVFVRNAEDCVATAGPVEFVAGRLMAGGFAVRGVVLRRGPVDSAVEIESRSFRTSQSRLTRPRRWSCWATLERRWRWWSILPGRS